MTTGANSAHLTVIIFTGGHYSRQSRHFTFIRMKNTQNRRGMSYHWRMWMTMKENMDWMKNGMHHSGSMNERKIERLKTIIWPYDADNKLPC